MVARAAYGDNSADQRFARIHADNCYWLFGYDALGQLTSARKHWPDGTAVLGQQFEYSFDDIGNRKLAVTGGGQWRVNTVARQSGPDAIGTVLQKLAPIWC